MRALMIDDSRAHRLVTHRALVDLGFEVTEAESAQEALGRLKGQTKFDVVLVDWEIPQMDGLQFIKQVRAIPASAETPIILLGTTKFLHRLTEALEAGANEYIMKPFNKDILEMKLDVLGIEVS
jgi:two-component system, chemotaxis family, chemotaxis protein CheY